jgi:hypothetical protein
VSATLSLRDLRAGQIAAFIGDAAQRWGDADFPPRVRATAAIAGRLGYSIPVIDYALDRLFCSITEASLSAAIEAELGSLCALDDLASRPNTPAAWARGVERAVVVASDTTIGVALAPALFAICAKCGVVVKDRNDALVAEFFASLVEEHPAFATAARASAWAGGDVSESTLFAEADTVVAFGRDDALTAIRSRCGPATRFVPYGHRVSIGRLSAAGVAALDDERADAIVRDALLYDGEGCLSLHATFVTARGVAFAAVADRLARACERAALEFPAGVRSAERVAAIGAYRNLARFRAATNGTLLVARGDAILVETPPDVAPPLLPGVIPLVAVDSDDDVASYVAGHRLPVQALGVDTVDADALALTARIGAVRMCLFGTMQDPPLAGHHGGEARIAPFVRWIDAR